MWVGKLVEHCQRCYNALLPSIILANVQGINNKIIGVDSRIANFLYYRDCDVYCFTETWLASVYQNSALQPPGFSVCRHDRNCNITGESRGCGVCFMINENCCSDDYVISQGTTSSVESIAIKC